MFVIEGGTRFVIPRTELTYPCHVLRMHENASQAAVDHVMADFEDACPYEFKGAPSRSTMVEALSHPVKMFQGSYQNIKVTTADDLIAAEAFLKASSGT